MFCVPIYPTLCLCVDEYEINRVHYTKILLYILIRYRFESKKMFAIIICSSYMRYHFSKH